LVNQFIYNKFSAVNEAAATRGLEGKQMLNRLALSALILATVLFSPHATFAADLRLSKSSIKTPAGARHPIDACGCLRSGVYYDREIVYGYGPTFDPRYMATSEPHYFLGNVRAYTWYWR
jgi:hypothetical protein